MKGLSRTLGLSSITRTSAPTFSPTDIPSLVSWHDATDTSTITDSGSGLVSSWADKSGNGNTFSQGTGTNRPTTGTRTQNSLNVLDFDGNDSMSMASFGGAEGQPNTLYVAGVFDLLTSNRYMVDGIDAGNREALLVTSSNFTALAPFPFLTHGAADTNFHIFKIVFNGASTIIGVDGSDITGNAGAGAIDGLTIGSAYNNLSYMNGAIGEVVFCNAALSAGDEASLETYLSRWIP